MENNRFEDSLKSAFEGAEVSPSEKVWANVELDLEKASGGQLKRNLLLFQLLAAASVAFAFGIGALYYLDQPVNQDEHTKQALTKPSTTNSAELNKSVTGATDNNAGINNQKRTEEPVIQTLNNTYVVKKDNNTIPSTTEAQTQHAWVTYKVAKTDLSSFTRTKTPTLILPKHEDPVEPDAGMLLLARLKDEEKRYQQEDKKTNSKENIWASVGFGAGSYKPNVQSSNTNLESGVSAGTSSSESAVTGASYSVGLNVAGKISKRFIVQGGVSYLTQNADFTSTATNHGAASLNDYVKASNFESFNFESPYTVTSSLQFVSIPVQAGYILVDRNFGVQLNGGVATDLFIRNTLTPQNDDYQKVTQSSGKDSPYRTVNFSGLLGTEFSYRVANHYRISLNPGLRYSLNSIYKEEVAAEITPVTFDVSLRFRYIFK